MKTLAIIALALTLLVAGCARAETKVSMKDFLYTPAEVTVKAGEEVTWTNADIEAHTITSDTWDSGAIEPGKSYSRTFDTAGTYEIHCLFHPTMLGKVTVISGGSR